MPSTRRGASTTRSVPVEAAQDMKLKTQTRTRGTRKAADQTLDFDAVSGLNVVSPAVAPSSKRVWSAVAASENAENAENAAERQTKRRRSPRKNEQKGVSGVDKGSKKTRDKPKVRDAEGKENLPLYPTAEATADDMAVPQGTPIEMLLSTVEAAVGLESKVIATTLANTHEDHGTALLRILTQFQQAVNKEFGGHTDEEESVQEEIRRLSRQESMLEEKLRRCTNEALQWEALRKGLASSSDGLIDVTRRDDSMTANEIDASKESAEIVSATDAIETAFSKAGGAFAVASKEAQSLLHKLKKLESDGGIVPTSEQLQRQLFSAFMQLQRKNGASADVRDDIRGILK